MIFGVLIGLVLGGCALSWAQSGGWFDFDGIGGVVTLIAGILLLIASVTLALNRLDLHTEISQFGMVRETAEQAEALDVATDVAFRLKVAEVNQWLVEVQYWNHTLMDWWIPDEVDKLEPIGR